jgi:hypothetical protein
MLKYNDIKDAFVSKLENIFDINIYDESIQQGFEEPAFFVQLIPIGNTRENKNIRSRLLLIDIQYFPKDNSNEDAFNMADELEQLFNDYIQVKDRALKLDNIDYEVTYDGIGITLHFKITINYFESIVQEEKGELAENLIFTRR